MGAGGIPNREDEKLDVAAQIAGLNSVLSIGAATSGTKAGSVPEPSKSAIASCGGGAGAVTIGAGRVSLCGGSISVSVGLSKESRSTKTVSCAGLCSSPADCVPVSAVIAWCTHSVTISSCVSPEASSESVVFCCTPSSKHSLDSKSSGQCSTTKSLHEATVPSVEASPDFLDKLALSATVSCSSSVASRTAGLSSAHSHLAKPLSASMYHRFSMYLALMCSRTLSTSEPSGFETSGSLFASQMLAASSLPPVSICATSLALHVEREIALILCPNSDSRWMPLQVWHRNVAKFKHTYVGPVSTQSAHLLFAGLLRWKVRSLSIKFASVGFLSGAMASALLALQHA
mmetsp:Transcript_36538/g.97337  ORF Transcript_36538/g.97337 Transcript_36538/m.97337 type:complete len:345 (-) Transcript_36538:3-1037(-)